MRFNTALIPSQRYDPPGGQWWRSGIVYQVYPRSFQDSDSDGIGDLRGVRSRLDYLERLGVDAIWLSPVYASPQEDNGYDISDYRAIDPLFGTMEDLVALLDDVHARGMRLIMDIVVNHTSTQHQWFRESRFPSSPKRDWYYWRPARPGHSPGAPGSEPNNWESFFSGPAWCFDEESGEYYLHLFAPGQADLNWGNPQVRRAVYDMMNWWLDLGVDGFRVDAIDMIAKEEGLPDGGPARPPFASATSASRAVPACTTSSRRCTARSSPAVPAYSPWARPPAPARIAPCCSATPPDANSIRSSSSSTSIWGPRRASSPPAPCTTASSSTL